MWLSSRFASCPVTDEALVLEGGDEFGAQFLVAELGRHRLAPVVRLVDVPDDAKAVGGALAEAVNAALGRPLLHHGFTWQVQLRALRQSVRPPMTLVVAGGEEHAEFLRGVAAVCDEQLGAWFLFSGDPQEVAGRKLTKGELALRFEEARWLAPTGVSDAELARLLKETGGAYTLFVQEVYRRPGLPQVVVPFADRPLSSTWEAEFGDKARVLEDLKRQRRWIEATALAVESDPAQVEDLLELAGREFQARGRLYYLYDLLRRMPEELLERARTLEWLIVASASAVGFAGAQSHLARVARFLEKNEAPELRARFATLIPEDEGVVHALRAAEAKPTPLTLWQAGRMNRSDEQALKYLHASIMAAEAEGDWYGVARAAESLAARYLCIGDYPAGYAWSSRGLEVFEQQGLLDGFRRLRLLHSHAAARIALGDTAGVEEELLRVIDLLGDEMAHHAHDLRGCLRDVYLLDGKPEAALEQIRLFYEAAPRKSISARIVPYVRALIEVEDLATAERVAFEAASLARTPGAPLDERNQLAIEMVRAYRGEQDAADKLRELMLDEDHIKGVFEYSCIAAAYYLLLRPDGVCDVPQRLRQRLAKASPAFLKLITGPEKRFAKVERLLQQEAPPRLVIKALGRPNITLDGKPVRASDRRLEVLVALALNPQGLTTEALHAFMEDESRPISMNTVRSTLSQIRSDVPLTPAPARIEVTYSLDVLDLLSHLRAGNVSAALELFEGELMPSSRANGIEELRKQVEGELRAAVLASSDAEVLYAASMKWSDDIEMCEAARNALPVGDPRTSTLAGRLGVLERTYALT